MGSAEGAMSPAIPTAQPHVSVRVLYPFAAALREEGVDLDSVLAAAQIPRTTYDNPDLRIPVIAARRFHAAAGARSRDRALGLAAARHFAVAQFQIIEYFAATSTHLGAALDTLVKSERVLSDVNAIRVEPRAEGVLLRVEPLTAGWHRCWIEFAVGAIYLAGRRIVGAAAPPHAIPWFAYPSSAYTAEYDRFFGTSSRFDAPASGLLIPFAVLQQRLETMDTRLHDALELQLKDWALRVKPGPSFLERARMLLRKSLPEGDSCIDTIATNLHMSRSTLRRRLAQEGVTHRSLLTEVRRDLALRYLQQRDLSIKEVAYLVGYHPAAFNKAFRKWTGVTPVESRARMQSDGNGTSRAPDGKSMF
jgi:AraC-like DNA-binding protein